MYFIRNHLLADFVNHFCLLSCTLNSGGQECTQQVWSLLSTKLEIMKQHRGIMSSAGAHGLLLVTQIWKVIEGFQNSKQKANLEGGLRVNQLI